MFYLHIMFVVVHGFLHKTGRNFVEFLQGDWDNNGTDDDDASLGLALIKYLPIIFQDFNPDPVQ